VKGQVLPQRMFTVRRGVEHMPHTGQNYAARKTVRSSRRTPGVTKSLST
jgi:hypothetical protein